MTSPADLKIIDRIKKLHAMAISAKEVGSLAEADSFMEAVSKTLAKHNLDSAVLSIDTRDLHDPLGYASVWGAKTRGRTKRPIWAAYLAQAVGDAHYCAVLTSTESSVAFFYGRKSNYETAAQMFTYLRDLGEKEGVSAWRKFRAEYLKRYGGHGHGDSINWYMSWLEGFSLEVNSRYKAMRARVEADKGMSLVLVSVKAEADSYSKQFESKSAGEWIQSTMDRTAVALGVAAARKANLRPNVVDAGDETATKRIG